VKQIPPLVALLMLSSHAHADYRDDIAYTRLQTELGAAIPNGQGVCSGNSG